MYSMSVYICAWVVFAFEKFFFLSAEQHFLLACHARLLALCLTQVVAAARPPVWARFMLHIGPVDRNSCHAAETNKF